MSEDQNTRSNLPTTNGRDGIIGIDPGDVHLGLAHIKNDKLIDYCVRVIPSDGSVRERLNNLDAILGRYLAEKNPSAIAVEKAYFTSGSNNGLLLLAYYKILAVARRRRIPVYSYGSTTIRKALTGYGHSTKQSLNAIILSAYPELRNFEPGRRSRQQKYFNHILSAVGCGLTHIKKTNDRIHT